MGPKKFVDDILRFRSFEVQFHSETTIDGITFHFSEAVASDNSRPHTKGKDAVDPAGGAEVIESWIYSSI